MKNVDHILNDDIEVLTFLKDRYPLYHLSNIFFRDIQYGIQMLFERRGARISYTEAEQQAREFVERLEKKKIFVPIDRQSWALYYEEFKTRPSKPAPAAKAAVPAKPAASAPAAPRPAGGLPPLKSSPAAGTAKPSGGLPPLKSSAPASGARPATPPAAPASAPVAAAVVIPELVQETQASPQAPREEAPAPQKPAATGGPKGLPPIKSSVPAGKK